MHASKKEAYHYMHAHAHIALAYYTLSVYIINSNTKINGGKLCKLERYSTREFKLDSD